MSARLLLLAVALILPACATVTPELDTARRELVPETWFAGSVVGEGVFHRLDRGADIPFTMVIDSAWDGTVLTMDESFISAKGRWRRVWTIRRTGELSYAARLSTGDGPGAVERAGDTVRMRYRARTPLVERPFVARFDQRLRLRPDGTVLNTADVYKFGVRIGWSTVVFRRLDGAAPLP